MRFAFDGYEVDTETRELRFEGVARALQPKAFAVLEFLLRERERAVSKQELLAALWPDAVVSEGSLQRAISLARGAIDDDGRRIKTVPRHGYRFVAQVTVPEADGPAVAVDPPLRPRFAKSGDVHIAYHTLGERSACDIVFVPAWAFPMRAYFDHEAPRALLGALSRMGRVILFDKRGTGLSDRIKELPTIEQRVDDLRAVLDACGSRRALLVGFSEGGPLCAVFALAHPERTHGLLFVGSFARWGASPDYPHGWTEPVVERLRAYIEREWGAGRTISAIAASRKDDPEVDEWSARAEQEGASPGAALELLTMNLEVDVRALLPAIRTPTVVLHHDRDAVIHVGNGRYLAQHIPGAELEEVEGEDHVFLFQDQARLLGACERLLRIREVEPAQRRFLSTLLVAEGDDASMRERARAFGGEPARGGGAFGFDGPQRAIRCAHALLSAGAASRAGVHVGEVARGAHGLEGDALELARSLMAEVARGEVWVTRVVRDLVHGSDLGFEALDPVAGLDLPVLRSRGPGALSEG